MGVGELLVIFVIVVFLFGARKLPALGDALGKTVRNFREATGRSAAAPPPEKKELPPAGGTGP
jgi:sec-independent protein translocase protein TatA